MLLIDCGVANVFNDESINADVAVVVVCKKFLLFNFLCCYFYKLNIVV